MYPFEDAHEGEVRFVFTSEEGKEYTMSSEPLTIKEEDYQNEGQKMNKQPTLGLKPRYIHEEQRAREIGEAICRRLKAGEVVPSEWLKELGELMERKEHHRIQSEDSESSISGYSTSDLVGELKRREGVKHFFAPTDSIFDIRMQSPEGRRSVEYDWGDASILVVKYR